MSAPKHLPAAEMRVRDERMLESWVGGARARVVATDIGLASGKAVMERIGKLRRAGWRIPRRAPGRHAGMDKWADSGTWTAPDGVHGSPLQPVRAS